MNYKILVPLLSFIIAFIISAVFVKVAIPILHKFKFGQFVRDDGPETHLKKAGTPTMGGIVFVPAILIASVIAGIVMYNVNVGDLSNIIYIVEGSKSIGNPTEYFKPVFVRELVLILILTVGYGFVGFLDDFLKIKHKQSEGLKAWQKLLLQMIITTVFIALYCIWGSYYADKTNVVLSPNTIIIPFTFNEIKMPMWLFVIFAYFVTLGTDNGTNLTDGLDGLLSFVTLPVAVFLGVAATAWNFYGADKVVSAGTVVAFAVLGALIGFLIYNHYPAKIMMGDTGSLAIGGFVAATAIVMHIEIFILIFGFVYLMETISVIMQVGYFKLTHGKRIFKMAPIHHHFEKCSWSEKKIVAIFTLVSVICCLIAYY